MGTTTTTPAYEAGTLHHVDPARLLLRRNIREAALTPELVDSVRDVGVLQPVVAVVTPEGDLMVRYGQRRTLAAVEAARPTVPVYVAGSDDLADEAEISRIVGQHAENTHRAGLTAGDDVAVFEQLAAFGLPADQIATRTRSKPERVETALRVSRSELAKAAAGRYESLTLEQAATVAEFEHDTELAKTLVVAAVQDPGKFAHLAQEARDDQLRENRRQKLVEELSRDAVVVDVPEYDAKTKRLDYLKGNGDKPLTAAAHKKCPGHVAWLMQSWEWVDQAGNPVQRVDHAAGHRNIQTWKPYYGCSDPKKHGHEDLYSYSGGSSTSTTKAADMSEEEREKAKKDRRLVIDNNKAWDSATVVRQEFLADLAKGKTAPKGAAAFIVTSLGLDRTIITNGDVGKDSEYCTSWGLTMAKVGYHGTPTVPAKATEARALVIALVQVLAAHETNTDRMAWRRNGKTSREGRYLRFLESCGYGLSDVEKFALNTRTV